MGAYVCFDRHIHIGYETRTNGILSQLGYVDINEQMLNEIVSNKRPLLCRSNKKRSDSL